MGIISRNDKPADGMDRAESGSRSGKPARSGGGTTVIAAGTRLVGDLTLEDSFHLDGSMEGDVRSEGDVSVGRSGEFAGDIRAQHVVVSGTVKGSIDCERLEIVTNGRVTGDVVSSELVIEAGARFSGSSRIKDEDEMPSQQHSGPKAVPAHKPSDNALPLGDAKEAG